MTRYVAFLRAVNVGGRVVKMEALRKIFESMRFANVATFVDRMAACVGPTFRSGVLRISNTLVCHTPALKGRAYNDVCPNA